MAVNYYSAFVHGSKTFLLDGTQGLTLAPDYVPPGINVNVSMAGGLLGNQMSGADVVRKQYQNRALTIPLQSKGTTIADTHGSVATLESFIESCLSDDSEKLYFVFGSSNALTYTPKWGQLFRKYEVKVNYGSNVGGLYGTASVRKQYVPYNLPLEVAPFANGERQRLGSATGGILEHSYATKFGESRGLSIQPARTNEVANPIFGHGTWNTGWADGADLIDAENTDAEFILFGSSSAKLTATGGSTNYYRTSVDCAASDFSFGAYFKLQDSGVIDGTVVVMAYDSGNLTENYRAVGDGWYHVWATETGTGAAADLDYYVAEGHTVYMDMAAAENGAFPTAPFYGDMLDCSWAGTAHNSDSTRTSASWKIDPDEVLNIAEGCVRVVWNPMLDYDDYGTSTQRIFYASSGFRLSWDGTNNLWSYIDGTNTVNSAATTYSANTPVILHAVWDPDGIELYVNGVSGGSGTYTPADFGASLYLGSSTAPSERAMGTFGGLLFLEQRPTAAEILADYNDISAFVTGGDGFGQCLNPIPWAWFDQGDDILDNDYVSGSKYNFFVSGGIPGNLPASTQWWINVNDANFEDDAALYISNQPYPLEKTFKFSDYTFVFQDGATDSVNTTDMIFVVNGVSRFVQHNQDYYAYVRCIDAGSNLRARFAFIPGSTGFTKYIGDYESFTPDAATYKSFLLGPVVPSYKMMEGLDSLAIQSSALYPVFSRSVAGAANLTVDYCLLMPDPLRIEQSISMAARSFIVEGKYAMAVTTASGFRISDVETVGEIQDFHPNSINFLWCVIGKSGNDNVTTRTTEWKTYVTPRWSLL